jgi:hypothetical protein
VSLYQELLGQFTVISPPVPLRISLAAATTAYELFESRSVFISVGLSILNLVELRFFHRSEFIHILYKDYMYRSYLIDVLSARVYHPQ